MGRATFKRISEAKNSNLFLDSIAGYDNPLLRGLNGRIIECESLKRNYILAGVACAIAGIAAAVLASSPLGWGAAVGGLAVTTLGVRSYFVGNMTVNTFITQAAIIQLKQNYSIV